MSFTHPDYNGKASYFDVAILQTDPLEYTKYVKPGKQAQHLT